MSITFWNPANPAQFEDRYDPMYKDMYTIWVGGGLELNLSNSNALEVLQFLNVPKPIYCGEILARELEVLCRRALIRLDNISDLDEEIPTRIDGSIITPRRPSGYLRGRVEELLRLSLQRITDNDQIFWG